MTTESDLTAAREEGRTIKCSNCAKIGDCQMAAIYQGNACKRWEGKPVEPLIEKHQKPICPLPRVGSKGWGWGVKYKPPFNEPVWHSPLTRIVVERYEEQEGVSEFNHRGCYIVIRPGRFGFNSVIYGFKNAFRFAELLARRDWRRENRGKK